MRLNVVQAVLLSAVLSVIGFWVPLWLVLR